MVDMINIARDADLHIHPLDSRKILGKRIIAKNGKVIGTVSEIRIHPQTMKVLGIVLRLNWTKTYIGVSYISKITPDSVMLNMDPSILMKGKRVYTHEGQDLGKIKKVVRRKQTNDVVEIIVTSLWKKKMEIPYSAIGFVNKSVLLSKNYHGKQKYFWQKN